MRINRRSSRWLLAALLVVLAGAPGAIAQLQTGNIYGTVSDDQGNPLPGVTLTLSGAGAPTVQTTDAQGRFRFPSLGPGAYSLRAEMQGFSTLEYPNVAVNIGRNPELELVMNAAVEDVITVTAETPLLDERRISTGATVSQTELEKIPTARDPWAILQSTPGVLTDRINVGGNESGQQSQYVGPGSTGDQAVWSVDGVVITDMAAIGSSPAYYDFDSFEEMQVTTGGADATIATGGVVLNMVTKRGTNEWRGTGRYMIMDDGSQSNLDFSTGDLGHGGAWNTASRSFKGDGSIADPGGHPNPQTAFKQGNRIVEVKDWGFELGGPIVQDRLWIWGAYAKPEIDLLTVSDVSDFTELETSNVKLNAQIATNNSGTLFALQSDKVKIGRNAGPQRPQETTWNQSKFGDDPTAVKLEDTHIVSSNFYLTGLYSLVNGGFQLVPQGGLSAIPFLDGDLVWHNSFLLYQTERPQEQVKLDASNFFQTGSLSHELKYGAGYRETDVTSLSRWPGNGQQLDWIAAFGVPAPYNLFLAVRDAGPSYTTDYTSAYLQDTLSVGNLTVNASLRYDLQGGKNQPRSIGASSYLPGVLPAVSVGSSDIGFEWESIVPRLGLTYALGAERKTLLRASYSRFADQLGGVAPSWLNPLTGPGYAYFVSYNSGVGTVPLSDLADLNGDGVIDSGDTIAFSGNVNPSNGGLLVSNALDPGLEAPTTDELLLSFEHALRPEFVVGLNLTYRQINDILESELLVFDNPDAFCTACLSSAGRRHQRSDYEKVTLTSRNVRVINPDGSESVVAVPLVRPDGTPYTLTYYQLRSGLSTRNGLFLENGDREQEYKGVSLTFNKRLANRWMLRGNFTWADWEWSDVPDSELEDLTQTLGGGDRSGDAVLQGSGTGSGSKGGIYINSEWSYSVNGLYQVAPDRGWGFNVALDLSGRQGYPLPYFQRVGLPARHQFAAINVQTTDRPDSFRLDDVHQVNARVEKEFTFNDLGLTLSLDGFNLFNEATVLQRNHRLGVATGDHVREVVSPRVFRAGVRLSFR